jgi:general stress protein YciG
MPNNNPQGHNQYTKRREQMQPGAATAGTSSDTTGDLSDPIDIASANTQTINPPTSQEVSPGQGTPSGPAKRGFAAMDEATQRIIASKGGQSQGKENNPGNFANDRDRAREAGRKGGEAHGHRQQ